ncbi:hypothetical protein N9L26_00210 [Candidatus Pacebacteria bacterium]|nr:hypothetical protein [Candidatus Paceibacterota bacterium]
MQSPTGTANSRMPSTLYAIVFEYRVVRYAVRTLLLAFLIQPIAPAYANEIIADNSESDTAILEVQSEPAPEELASETSEEATEAEPETDTVITESQIEDTVETLPGDEFESEATLEDGAVSDEDTAEDGAVEDAAANELTETGSVVVEPLESMPESGTTAVESDTIASTTHADTAEPDSLATAATETEHASSTDQEDTETLADSPTIDPQASTTASTTDSQSQPTAPGDISGEISEPEPEPATDFTEENESSDDTEARTTASSTEADPAETNEERAADVIATTTSTTATTTVQRVTLGASTVINDENRHQFGTDDCVTVGDGAFYCSQEKSTVELLEDEVYAAPDAEGDLEIFVRVNGETTQITHNQFDDAAPYFDPLSQTIVWHTLKADRYQIATYEFDTAETKYLTDTSYNNMEPASYGDLVIWQAWIGNNWEIMLYDGASTTQFTSNDIHDVAPHIRGDYIVWQAQFLDGWQVAIYDRETQSLEYVTEGAGRLVENPRFLLVYDSESENGDIETFGYDLDNKTASPLASLPSPAPQRLPEPDTTGEERALIQSKTSGREESPVEGNPDIANPPTPQPNATSSTATASGTDSTMDVVIPQYGSETPVASSTPAELPTSIVDIDMTVETSGSTATSTEHIEDVVIPPVTSASSTSAG